MVFDGSGPLVKRCDGFDGSLWSNYEHEDSGDDRDHEEDGDDPDVDDDGYDDCGIEASMANGDDDYDKMILKGMTMMMTMMMTM